MFHRSISWAWWTIVLGIPRTPYCKINETAFTVYQQEPGSSLPWKSTTKRMVYLNSGTSWKRGYSRTRLLGPSKAGHEPRKKNREHQTGQSDPARERVVASNHPRSKNHLRNAPDASPTLDPFATTRSTQGTLRIQARSNTWGFEGLDPCHGGSLRNVYPHRCDMILTTSFSPYVHPETTVAPKQATETQAP